MSRLVYGDGYNYYPISETCIFTNVITNGSYHVCYRCTDENNNTISFNPSTDIIDETYTDSDVNTSENNIADTDNTGTGTLTDTDGDGIADSSTNTYPDYNDALESFGDQIANNGNKINRTNDLLDGIGTKLDGIDESIKDGTNELSKKISDLNNTFKADQTFNDNTFQQIFDTIHSLKGSYDSTIQNLEDVKATVSSGFTYTPISANDCDMSFTTSITGESHVFNMDFSQFSTVARPFITLVIEVLFLVASIKIFIFGLFFGKDNS